MSRWTPASTASAVFGEAVITDAFGLPNAYVIHCLGPDYGIDQPEAELPGQCYRAAIAQADAKKIGSIAFPAISTGAFSYPIDGAAPVACTAVVQALRMPVTLSLFATSCWKAPFAAFFADETLKAISRTQAS